MKITMEEAESIIQNRDIRAVARAILSCREITDLAKWSKETYGENNVTLFSTKDYNSAYRHAVKGFQDGMKLEGVTVPMMKGEPRNGNYRVLMVRGAIETAYEMGGRCRLAAPRMAIAADDFQPGVTRRMN